MSVTSCSSLAKIVPFFLKDCNSNQVNHDQHRLHTHLKRHILSEGSRYQSCRRWLRGTGYGSYRRQSLKKFKPKHQANSFLPLGSANTDETRTAANDHLVISRYFGLSLMVLSLTLTLRFCVTRSLAL